MVAHFTMRTHGLNQAFRFVEGIWLHRKNHQIRVNDVLFVNFDTKVWHNLGQSFGCSPKISVLVYLKIFPKRRDFSPSLFNVRK